MTFKKNPSCFECFSAINIMVFILTLRARLKKQFYERGLWSTNQLKTINAHVLFYNFSLHILLKNLNFWVEVNKLQ